jgi:TonB family protein
MRKQLVVSLAVGVLLVPALAAEPGRPVPAGEVLRPSPQEWCPEGAVPSPDNDCITLPVLLYAGSPPYPELAMRGRITGRVEVEAVIAASGKVTEVRVIKPNRIFTEVAVAAVKLRMYKPAYRRGEPVAVCVPIEVRFDLAPPGWRPAPGTSPGGPDVVLVTPWGLQPPIVGSQQRPPTGRDTQGPRK